VDSSGLQYRSVPTAPAGLPLLVVPAGSSARMTGGAVATVAAALPPAILQQVTSIQALDPKAITLVLSHGRIVRWGSADRTADKARVLPTLLATLSSSGATQIDLTDPDQPFTR
jgi:cell division protein FtsQ